MLAKSLEARQRPTLRVTSHTLYKRQQEYRPRYRYAAAVPSFALRPPRHGEPCIFHDMRRPSAPTLAIRTFVAE